MAKVSMIQKNNKRGLLIEKYKVKRQNLKKIIKNKDLTIEERFAAQCELASLPRDSSPVRYRNRCLATGRPRGYIRSFAMSRIVFRDMASFGFVPGVVKSGC